MPDDINSILIINLGGIGDILLSTPALKAISGRYAGARVSMLAIPAVRETVKDLSCVDEVILFDPHLSFGNLFKDLAVLMGLRKRKFDLAVNMRTLVCAFSAFKMKTLLGIVEPRLKAGRNTDGRGDFFDIAIEESLRGDKHEMDYDMEMAAALGAKAAGGAIDLKIDAKSLEDAERILKENGVTPGDLVINMHMGGKPSHRWPERSFFALMKKLNEGPRRKFLVTGEAADRGLITGLAKESCIAVINMAGRLNIKELAAMISLSGLCVSNDTGPMHIAAILNTPLVAIFGPGYLTRFDPRRISERTVVIYNKAPCAPCDKIYCDSMECLKSIPVDKVFEAAAMLLKKTGRID